MAYTIDTAAAISDLEDAGIESTAARAIVRTVATASDELATKSDLAAVKTEIMAELALQRSALTVRIVGAQVATATLLFAAIRFLGA